MKGVNSVKNLPETLQLPQLGVLYADIESEIIDIVDFDSVDSDHDEVVNLEPFSSEG